MRAVLLTLLLGLCPLLADAQTLWSRPYEPNQVTVEALVPDAADGAGLPTGATFVTATASITENIELSTELPIAHYRPASGGGGSATALGNPFVGLGFSSTRVPLLFQLGARIPNAPSNAATPIGSGTDVGRSPAFVPDEFSLTGLLNGRREIGQQSTARARVGLGYASRPSPLPAGDRRRDWRMHYDLQFWQERGWLLTGLTLTGRALLTSPGTTQHHATLSVMGDWTRVQPGLLVGTSLNDLVQDGTFVPFGGLTLSVSYGRF
jgi:hypothetical protein